MDVYRSKHEISSKRPSAVALGFFDGLHRGHTELISKCVSFAKSRGMPADVFTFRDHPKNILSGKLIIPRLLPETEKLERLEELGVDRVYNFDFSDGFHTMPPFDFAKIFLGDLFFAKTVFCGFNYHFGAEASGDTKTLKGFGEIIGFETNILDPVFIEELLVSSSLIRHLINNGEIESAGRMLGRDYGFNGIVEKGNKLGRSFGFPTANIVPEPELTLPALGVYVTETYENGNCYPSVSNIGVNPTVSEGKAVRVETHLLDTDCSLYGKKINVLFKKMLREERCFESKEALVKQITKDADSARSFFLSQ
jgi:riboflavin kinase/FMN adenylyltransferase